MTPTPSPPGHTLVIPHRHVATDFDASAEERQWRYVALPVDPIALAAAAFADSAAASEVLHDIDGDPREQVMPSHAGWDQP